MNKYYSLEQKDDALDVHIYGDMVSYKWDAQDVTAYDLAKDLQESKASKVNVYIDSYGGETSIGMAVYNALKRHEAEVTTYCDGFACSAASLAFMAGDKRVMNKASLLMIHNAWTFTAGNAKELRKEADDLDKISETAARTYKEYVSISEDELNNLLDAESWIKPEQALSWGFATEIYEADSEAPQSSVKMAVIDKILSEEDPDKNAEEELEEGIDIDELAEAIADKVVEKLDEKEAEPQEPETEPAVFELLKKNFGGK